MERVSIWFGLLLYVVAAGLYGDYHFFQHIHNVIAGSRWCLYTGTICLAFGVLDIFDFWLFISEIDFDWPDFDFPDWD
jgi:hypothetical protein